MTRSILLASAALIATAASAHADPFVGGDILVSKSTYDIAPSTIVVGVTPLPGKPGATAVADASYPNVFANNKVDGSFGITTGIALDQVNITGTPTVVSTLNIPASAAVTSFSSKSELGLSLSTDGTSVSFSGYAAPKGTLDVSNSNTGAVHDATNPVAADVNRVIVQVDRNGSVTTTPTTAYSGNNQRNVIVDSKTNTAYIAGNAGNGGNAAATLAAIGNNTGVQKTQIGTPIVANPAYNPALPEDVGNSPLLANTSKVGNFNVTQYGYPADKQSKDNNFRGITIANNTLYVTKGSGGNGINTVYQVGTAGTLPGALGQGEPITILNGFNTKLAADASSTAYPFGLFFANPNTLYVSEEGSGTIKNGVDAGAQGLEKWTFDGTKWSLAYTLKNGLNLNSPYSVAGLPTTLNPSTDGLRNITGRVNADGSVTLIAVTSTVSANGDQGADPNEVVQITDSLAATSLPSAEAFSIVEAPTYGVVYRGVSFTPTPEPGALALLGAGLAGLGLVRRRR